MKILKLVFVPFRGFLFFYNENYVTETELKSFRPLPGLFIFLCIAIRNFPHFSKSFRPLPGLFIFLLFKRKY